MTKPLSFYNILQKHYTEDLYERFLDVRDYQVRLALEMAATERRLEAQHILALLSPAARPFLDEMARLAQDITWRHFGRTVQLFTPLYLSNYCTNQCIYCGFNSLNTIKRSRLSMEEIRTEAETIAQSGLRHILLLTGEAPKIANFDYIHKAVSTIADLFSGIGIEVFAMNEDEYCSLAEAGVDTMTLFQETYNEKLFPSLHPSGPKSDFLHRLDAPERAAKAGIFTINIGSLLGLDTWQTDVFASILHADYLLKHYPSTEIAFSIPRIRPHAGLAHPVQIVSDIDLVHIILAMRLAVPKAGITLSSRERADFRDKLIPLGITRVSAGVRTSVGGHSTKDESLHKQFEIADNRTVEEMYKAIKQQNYHPIFKHWQRF